MATLIDPLTLTRVQLDVTLSDQFDDSVEWTDFPVEGDLSISDHAIVQPVTANITGVISDADPSPTAAPGRARAAYEQLLEWRKSATLLTLITDVRVLQNVGIQSVSLARSAERGVEAVYPVVALKQIRIVNSITVPVPPTLLAEEVKPDATSEADAGKQTGTEAAEGGVDAQSADGSIGHQLKNGKSPEEIAQKYLTEFGAGG